MKIAKQTNFVVLQIAPQNIGFMFIDFVKVFRLVGAILDMKIVVWREREILAGMLNQNFLFQIKSKLRVACG